MGIIISTLQSYWERLNEITCYITLLFFNVYSAWHIVVIQQNDYFYLYNSSPQPSTSIYPKEACFTLFNN